MIDDADMLLDVVRSFCAAAAFYQARAPRLAAGLLRMAGEHLEHRARLLTERRAGERSRPGIRRT
jgi:hypothetical protein